MFDSIKMQQAGFNFANGILEAVNSSTKNVTLLNEVRLQANQFVQDIFTNAIQSLPSTEELIDKSVRHIYKFLNAAGVDTVEISSKLGSVVNEFFIHFFNDIHLEKISKSFMEEIADAFKSGVDGSDIKGNMGHLSDAVREGVKVFREEFFDEVNLFRTDIQGIFSNVARDTVLKTLPWIALGGSLLVGAPLLTYYVYKKAVYNIGRPTLAKKVRKVNIVDQTLGVLENTTASVFRSSLAGIKLSSLAGIAGINLLMASEVAFLILTGQSGYAGDIMSGLLCLFGLDSRYYCDVSAAAPLVLPVVASGMMLSSYQMISSFYSYLKEYFQKDVAPIFSTALQRKIDYLTQATYNIQKNKGYMQNVLLYGPGGTGKTMISEYIARNSNMNYVMMSGGDLAQHIKKGEHVSELNKLFMDAKKSFHPTILFIDECESLCGDRSKMQRSELIELLNSFLNHTGVPSKKIMVILTTNREEDLDPAVLSRMDHKLYIGPPEKLEREKILKLYISQFMSELEQKELFSDQVVSTIAEKIEGFTGRTIFKMLNSLATLRATTSNNTLTKVMLDETVEHFTQQERALSKG